MQWNQETTSSLVTLHPVAPTVSLTLNCKLLCWLLNPVNLNKHESFVFNEISICDQENSKCGILSCEFKSGISAQRRFRMIYKKHPHQRNNIQRRCKGINNISQKQTRPGTANLSNIMILSEKYSNDVNYILEYQCRNKVKRLYNTKEDIAPITKTCIICFNTFCVLYKNCTRCCYLLRVSINFWCSVHFYD